MFIWIGLLLSTIATGIFAQEKCIPDTQCSCNLKDGRKISLWPIDNGKKSYARFTVPDKQGQGYQYRYSPCTPFSTGNIGAECQNVLGCQSGGIGAGPFAIAYKDALFVDYNTNINMYTFTYTGSDTPNSGSRKMIIQLKCDKNAEEPSLEPFDDSTVPYYITTLTTKHVCLSDLQIKKALSIGSILCIVFFVLLVVFMAAGIAINKYALHKEGSDVVPLKSFWLDLPGLVKDGARFTYQKVRGKNEQYEQI